MSRHQKKKKEKKKIDTWVTPNSKTHPHAPCESTARQSGEIQAKGRLLPVPIGHLLTFSLDFSKFVLCRDLRDAFHADAFKENSSLGRKQKAELGPELKKPTPTHKAGKYSCGFPNRCFVIFESLREETTGRKNPCRRSCNLFAWPLFRIHLIQLVTLLHFPLGVIQMNVNTDDNWSTHLF